MEFCGCDLSRGLEFLVGWQDTVGHSFVPCPVILLADSEGWEVRLICI